MTKPKTKTLEEIRIERGLSVEKLAVMSGLSYPTTRAILSGRPGSLATKIKLSEALDMPFRQLWPETFRELSEIVSELDRHGELSKATGIITTHDLGNAGELTRKARLRRINEGC